MEYKLHFKKTIKKWDEAVPLGNGRMGALIWGEPGELRFSLDRTDIWDKSQPLYTDREEFTYAHMVRLAKTGNTDAIRELFDAPYNHPTPTKLPAGKLILHFAKGSNVESILDLNTAEVKLIVSEKAEAGSIADASKQQAIEIRSICHAVTGSGMVLVNAGCRDFQIELVNPEFGLDDEQEEIHYNPEEREISQGSLKKLHYPRAIRQEVMGNPKFIWFKQQIKDEYFAVIAGIKEEREQTLIGYRVVRSTDGEEPLEEAQKQLQAELELGYEKNLISHEKWWKEFWDKSSINLPDKFFEKQWYLTNYLFASCSRKGEYPMPLQGVWTADDGNLPPWKGDYHNDLNTQLSYSHFYKANHLEEGECFIDYLWNMREAAADFAKKFFGTEGICLPGVMSIDGKPLGGWPMYSLSPTQQIWLCQSFEQYYRYTLDETFLKEKAWVYLEETAKCMLGILEERNGFYYLPVSSSPEIHDDERESWVTPNSNYDLALLRYLFKTLTEFAKILENGREEYWRTEYEKLPSLAVNKENVLMLSPDESLRESHRHLSNAMAICPLRLLSYPEDKEVIDATVLDYERWGSGMWVGFSFAWMSHLYSIQKNGEGAFEQLRIFWESFCSPNGFHLNGDYKKKGYSTFHYRPFTLESNMYAVDALQEMLLQTKGNVIEVFPAIPEHWQGEEISFRSLRGETGILVSAKRIPHHGCEICLTSPVTQSVLVKTEQMQMEIELQAIEPKNVFIPF